MKGKAAIALDIDGTMTTADPEALQMLADHARDNQLSDLYINTARDEPIVNVPLVIQHSGIKGKLVLQTDVRGYGGLEGENMDRMIEREGVAPECAVLIDDLPENITGVESNGYIGIKVDLKTGITKDTVREVFQRLKSVVSHSLNERHSFIFCIYRKHASLVLSASLCTYLLMTTAQTTVASLPRMLTSVR